MRIVLLVGRKGSGKDTVADYLYRTRGFQAVKFAQTLKDVGSLLFGWDDRHKEGRLKEEVDPRYGFSPREFFQWFGTDVMQHAISKRFPAFWEQVGRRFWVHRTITMMERMHDDLDVVITDCRFPHEVDAIRAFYGPDAVLTIKLERERLTWWQKLFLHSSEKELDKISPDVILYNRDSIDALHKRVDTVVEHWF